MKKIFLLAGLILSLNAIGQVPSYIPTTGLVAWWPFDGNANDESANANNGTVNGASLTIDRYGVANKAYSFDGVDDFIEVFQPFLGGANAVTGYTISVWFKMNSLSSSLLLGQSSYWRSHWSEVTSSGQIGFNGENISGYYGATSAIGSITLNTWQNAIAVYDGNTLKIYLNNNLVVNQLVAFSSLDFSIVVSGNSTGRKLFGCASTVSSGLYAYHNGDIDDIGMWNRALNQQEIADLFSSTPCTAPTLSTTFISPTCTGASNGFINLTLTGGTPPFFYLWSNGATTEDLSGLGAGTYTVTVTSNGGCAASTSVTVTQPTVINNAFVIPNILCNGAATGIIDLTPSGGVGPYTYLWSNGAITQDIVNLIAGTYIVTVTDANGCTKADGVILATPNSVVIVVPPIAICSGQSGALTAAGAATYTWSPSASLNSSTGTSVIASPAFTTVYTVTGMNVDGCTGITTVVVTVNPTQNISETHVNANCSQTNGSIDITVNGSTYLWSNGATTQDINNLIAGTYTVTVTNSSGCTQSLSITITQLPSTCETPTNISVTNITGTKATVSWTGNSCAAKYRVRYRVQGTTTWVTKILTAPIITKTLTLLQPLTTYEYQVRSDCDIAGTVFSAYSTIQTFTTICDCTKPTNLAVSNVTQTGATVSWIGNACALKYRLQYRKQGTTTWTTKTINSPTLFYNIIGLTNNSIYEYHLRSDCNATGSINSGFTTTSTITTIPRLEDTEIGSSTFYVLPNPCSRCFVSGAENESDLIVTDIVGRIVSVEYTKSENGFYINMPDASIGFYLIRNNRTGEVVKFVKE